MVDLQMKEVIENNRLPTIYLFENKKNTKQNEIKEVNEMHEMK